MSAAAAAAAAAAASTAAAERQCIDTPIPYVDHIMLGPERKHMDSKLLSALRRGDERLVRRFCSEAGCMSSLGVTINRNTALHVVAGFRHSKLAELICARDSSLLAARNAALETPLHCAATAGADRIVSFFVFVVDWSDGRGGGRPAMLRAADREGRTALHRAAREGRAAAAAARVLMDVDPGLAAVVDDEGVSPLYAAVLSGSLEVVQLLIGSRADGGYTPEASYAGPNGQTALHAAAMIESSEIARELLQWKPTLAKKADKSGRTPLHYLASTLNHKMVCQLLNHDTSSAYLSNIEGLYPIHIAARMGRLSIIRELITYCPDMDELGDNKGRNFLHIAVEQTREKIVGFVCKQPLLAQMMNARDCEGNTPLHLAVKSKSQTIVGFLLADRSVHPSIVNDGGRTPLDLAIAQLDFGFVMKENAKMWIYWCLKGIGAVCGPYGQDHLIDKNVTRPNPEKELKKYESRTQSLVIASVLITTVTFAAVFTVPGGYKDDGTPILARKYAFKAFVISDFLAFVFSVIATILLMYAGSLTVDPSLRLQYIRYSQTFLLQASEGMVAAFALSVYVVLAPASKLIGILICIVTFPSILFASPGAWQRFRRARILKSRLGWLGMCKTSVIGQPRGFNMKNCYCYILCQFPLFLLANIPVFLVPLLLYFT